MDDSEEVLEDLEATLLPTVTEEEVDPDSTGDHDQPSERRGFPNEQSRWDTAQTVTLQLRNKTPRYLYALTCSYFPTLCFWCIASPLFQCKSCVGKFSPDGTQAGRYIECSADNYLGLLPVWLPLSVCTVYFFFPGRYGDGWHWHRFLGGMLTWTLLLIVYFGTANLCELHLFRGRPTPRHCPTPQDCYDNNFDRCRSNFDACYWWNITELVWLASWILMAARLYPGSTLDTSFGIGRMVFWIAYHVVVMIPYFACSPKYGYC